MKKKYYLSHSTEIRNDVRFWELKVEDNTGLELVNPFYDLLGPIFERIDRGVIKLSEYRNNVPKGEIVKNDLEAVDTCIGIVAYIKEPSFGTSMELFYGKINNKPIYVYCSPEYAKHPWLTYCTDNIYTDEEKFNEKLRELAKE